MKNKIKQIESLKLENKEEEYVNSKEVLRAKTVPKIFYIFSILNILLIFLLLRNLIFN